MIGEQQFIESSFYFTGFFICLSCLVFSLVQRRTKRPQNRIFFILLLNIMFGAASDAVSVFSDVYCSVSATAGFISKLSRISYFVIHASLAPSFYAYLVYVSGSIHVHRRHKRRFTLIMLPFLVTEILVVVNLFTGVLYYLDEDYVYHRGPLMSIFYLSAAFYLLLALLDIVLFWHAITPRSRKGIIYLFSLTLLGVVIQMINIHIQSEVFAESMALVLVMLFIENDEDRFDVSSGFFNRSALSLDLNSYIRMKIPFTATVVYVSNADVLSKLTGSAATEGLTEMVSDYLCSVHPVYQIYKTEPGCFVLLGIDTKAEEDEALSEKIRTRFRDPWNREGVEISLNSLVMQAAYPGSISTVEEVFLMSDFPKGADEAGHILREVDLDQIKRSIQVEQAMRRGFAEHNFEVYYQPVYFLDNLAIHSAEALTRLHDRELGEISPSEFIPVAERDGIIDRIGNFVLEEACLFLSSGLPVEMGIEYICVNLSILQCLRPGFADYARNMVLRYDVSPSLICFEIKESAATRDLEVLRKMIAELKQYGFRFSMDSYGTGLSDLQSLYSLDLDVIKIDKSILNGADEGSVGRVVLESCVRMIRQMHRRILVEGVETKEQIELLKKLNVDYLQGYYSSRPITKNELLGILRVTELARMEERRAIAASEAKSSFLANMSHEIRTPINAVLGMNEMILRECDESAVMRYAREIETAGRNLLSLINNILDYSKIEAGEMEIVEAEYDLKTALSDVIRDVYRKTDQKHLTFRVYVSEELPARLYGDEFRLKQVMMNILNNAVKYTDEGSIHLTIEGEYYSEEEVLLKIIVEDTGCGIREEDQSRLYEMFQRLDMERNRTVEGTGLGLAISYHLLQMMQGEIDVQSEYGVGSTFTIQLLQKAVSKERIRPYTAEELKDIFASRKGRREFSAPDARILVVDDTPLNHTVIRELLKSTGIQIETALSGEEGLELARKKYFDLIFMDQRMPGMGGSETLTALRAAEDAVSRRVPVISMTANAYPGIRDAERRQGFDDYLEKPVDSGKLLELILQYLPESKVFYS
ncbi:MAG: EAL domain-containing protein [Lachnospiraceae bacterium]|nr:EAL domain-containing protein [Lachnospiraceae bacterium]